MSGFITIYNIDGEPVDKQLIYSLTQTLKNKGPDRQDIWVDKHIGMGHALFKTTYEAEYEKQPATLDGHIWITCSARIDDRKNLVNKLGMKNKINLDKTPDSELILHAYRKWGENCLDHLLGDFAFAIWDSRVEKLFCARDRFGMRQLYYVRYKNSFIICNSINTLLQHPNISRKFNDKTIAGFLLFGDPNWLDPSLTGFEEITALKPSHSLIVKNGACFFKKYWDIPSDIPLLRYKKEQDYVEHFQEVFQTAVEDRIRTSSIVIFLSGGMDSSTIAATAAKLRKKKPFEIQAVTVGYEQLITDDEHYYADLVAKQLNIPIRFINGDKFPMIKSKLITSSPVQPISPDFWFEIRKESLKYSRVTLAGFAGDNLLAYSSDKENLKEMNSLHRILETGKAYYRYGYMPYLKFHIKKKIKEIIRPIRGKQISRYPSWIAPEFEKNMNLKELWNQKEPAYHMRHPTAYHTLLSANWSTEDMLCNNPLPLPEVRDPFLDSRLIELLFSFPSLPWFYKKHILRTSMKTILPSTILKRPKSLIGNLSYAYLEQPQNNWIDTFSPIQELSTYIDINKIPSFAGGADNPNISDINLRAVYLNEWMKNMIDQKY